MEKKPQTTDQTFSKSSILETAIALFNPSKEILAEMKQNHGTLTFEGLTDKEGINKIKKAHKEVKGHRIELGKSLRGFVSDMESIKKEIKTRVSTDADGFVKLETYLKGKLDEIKQQKEDAKKTKEYKELEEFTARTDELNEIGYEFDGANYILGTIVLDPGEIAKSNPDKWQEILNTSVLESHRLEELARAKENDQHPDPEPTKDEQPAAAPDSSPVAPDDDDYLFGDSSAPIIMAPIKDEPTAVEDYHPEGYKLGFDACRDKILKRLNDPTPIRRGDLKQFINDLLY